MLQKWKLKGSQTKDVWAFQGHFHGRKFTLQAKAEIKWPPIPGESRGGKGDTPNFVGGCTDGQNLYFLLPDFTFDPERCPPNQN